VNAFQRGIVRAINGSIQIGARCWRWPWQEAAWRRRARRAALLAFGLWSLYRLSGQWHWIGGAAIALLLAKGYRDGFVNEPPQQLVDVDHYEPDADAAVELDPVDARQLIIDSVLHLADGYANVLLSTLYAHMDAAQMELDLSAFRRWVESHDIPVRDAVKAARRVGIGIRVADLPAPRPAGPTRTPPPVVPDHLLQDW
jgi:hypothetical protein